MGHGSSPIAKRPRPPRGEPMNRKRGKRRPESGREGAVGRRTDRSRAEPGTAHTPQASWRPQLTTARGYGDRNSSLHVVLAGSYEMSAILYLLLKAAGLESAMGGSTVHFPKLRPESYPPAGHSPHRLAVVRWGQLRSRCSQSSPYVSTFASQCD